MIDEQEKWRRILSANNLFLQASLNEASACFAYGAKLTWKFNQRAIRLRRRAAKVMRGEI